MGLHAADSGGTLRNLREVWVADSGGTLRKLRELWVAGSDGVLRNVLAEPTVATCSGSAVGDQVTVSWSTGKDCQSVRVELRDQNGSPVPGGGPVTVDTNPNTSGYSHTFTNIPDGQYTGRVTPYSGDNAGGIEGSPCTTTTIWVSSGGDLEPM